MTEETILTPPARKPCRHIVAAVAAITGLGVEVRIADDGIPHYSDERPIYLGCRSCFINGYTPKFSAMLANPLNDNEAFGFSDDAGRIQSTDRIERCDGPADPRSKVRTFSGGNTRACLGCNRFMPIDGDGELVPHNRRVSATER